MRDISKTFPGVKALQHVDFTLRKGEIHALMGENGAGKSTLIKVLTGVHPFESGEIKMEGKTHQSLTDLHRMRRTMESVLYIRKSTFVRTLQLQKICLSDVNQEKQALSTGRQ